MLAAALLCSPSLGVLSPVPSNILIPKLLGFDSNCIASCPSADQTDLAASVSYVDVDEASGIFYITVGPNRENQSPTTSSGFCDFDDPAPLLSAFQNIDDDQDDYVSIRHTLGWYGSITGIFFKTASSGDPLGLTGYCDPPTHTSTWNNGFELGLGSLIISGYYYDNYFNWALITDANGTPFVANGAAHNNDIDFVYDPVRIKLLGTQSQQTIDSPYGDTNRIRIFFRQYLTAIEFANDLVTISCIEDQAAQDEPVQGLNYYNTGLDPNPTITYTFMENGTDLNTQLVALGATAVTLDPTSNPPVIKLPDMTGVTLGDYDFLVTAFSASDSTINANYFLTIKVEPDPCPTATIDTSAASTVVVSPHLYTSTTTFFAPYAASASCTITYACDSTVVATDLCHVGTLNTSTGQFDLDTTDKLNYPPGIYTVSIYASIAANPSSTVSATFLMDLIDPCSSATPTLTPTTNPLTHFYYQPTTELPNYTIDEASCGLEFTCVPPFVGLDLCPVVTIDAATGQFQLDTNDKASYPPDTYLLRMEVTVSGYTASDSHIYVINFVDLCSGADVTVPDQEDLIDYTYQEPLSFQVSYNTTVEGCVIEYSCVPPASGLDLCAVVT